MEQRILLTLLGAAGGAPAHEWLLARPDDAVVLVRSSGLPLPMAAADGVALRQICRPGRRNPVSWPATAVPAATCLDWVSAGDAAGRVA
ncbi:MAG: hypothetical protein ABR608_00950 [Pseudonocardiaceae bacterium]